MPFFNVWIFLTYFPKSNLLQYASNLHYIYRHINLQNSFTLYASFLGLVGSSVIKPFRFCWLTSVPFEGLVYADKTGKSLAMLTVRSCNSEFSALMAFLLVPYMFTPYQLNNTHSCIRNSLWLLSWRRLRKTYFLHVYLKCHYDFNACKSGLTGSRIWDCLHPELKP